MNPNIVAGLINRNYNNFNMFSFKNRIKVQKFVYIMQSMFQLNLGYEFNWYHYGPYCTELAKDCFSINFDTSPQVKFGDTEAEKRFLEFCSFIKNKDEKWLEIVASIHFLKKLGYPSNKIIETIKSKRKELSSKSSEINEIYKSLERGKRLDG